MGRGSDSRDVDGRTPERVSAPSREDRQPSERSVAWTHTVSLPKGEAREIVVTRSAAYRLRRADTQALLAAGSFRAVRLTDLAEFAYGGDRARAEQSVRHLRTQHLVETRTLRIDRRGGAATLVVLTKAGRGLLEQSDQARSTRSGAPQRFYSGWVKPAELRHDTALYRMVEIERRAIEASGGTVTRITIDAEMKRRVGRAIGAQQQASAALKREIAEALDLRVVHGRIQFPDVRLDVEWPDGRQEHRDLELVTEHYHRAHLAAKTGCRCYAVGSDPHIVTRMLNV